MDQRLTNAIKNKTLLPIKGLDYSNNSLASAYPVFLISCENIPSLVIDVSFKSFASNLNG